MQIFIYCKITLHISGVHRTHHQEYIKMQLQPLVPIMLSGKQAYQIDVLLIMGAMEARNTYSNLAVNKYLHTVASCWISST